MTARLRNLHAALRGMRNGIAKFPPEVQQVIGGHVERLKLQAHDDASFSAGLLLASLELTLEFEENQGRKKQ